MFLEDAGLCTDFFITHSTNNSDTNFFNIKIMKTPIRVDKIWSECVTSLHGMIGSYRKWQMFTSSM